MRMMALDFGSKTIGVAVSDELGMTAQGLKTIKRKTMKEDLAELRRIIDQYGIERIVIGLPKNMNGTLGEQAERVIHWVDRIKDEIPVPIETWDERFSTVEASRRLLEADVSRKKRKRVIDKLAAVIILQGYLQQFRSHNHDASAPT